MKCLPLELSEEWGLTSVRVYVSVLIQFILLIWNVSYVSYTTKYTKQLSYGTMAQNRYYPDKDTGNPEAAEKFKELAYSYGILSDPEKRRQYDAAGFDVCYLS
jgi:hypothetical protein